MHLQHTGIPDAELFYLQFSVDYSGLVPVTYVLEDSIGNCPMLRLPLTFFGFLTLGLFPKRIQLFIFVLFLHPSFKSSHIYGRKERVYG